MLAGTPNKTYTVQGLVDALTSLIEERRLNPDAPIVFEFAREHIPITVVDWRTDFTRHDIAQICTLKHLKI